MKKLVISAVALTLISFATVQASEPTVLSRLGTENMVTVTQEKVAVKPADLPKGIQSVIKSDDFKGWEITDAFLVTAPDKSQYYELSVKKGKESARVKLDKDGNNVG